MKKTLRFIVKLLPTGVVVALAAIAAMYLYAQNSKHPWTRFGHQESVAESWDWPSAIIGR